MLSEREEVRFIIKRSHKFEFFRYKIVNDAAATEAIKSGYEFSVDGVSDIYYKGQDIIRKKVNLRLEINVADAAGKISKIGDGVMESDGSEVYVEVALTLKGDLTKDLYDLFSNKIGAGFRIFGHLVSEKSFEVSHFYVFDGE